MLKIAPLMMGVGLIALVSEQVWFLPQAGYVNECITPLHPIPTDIPQAVGTKPEEGSPNDSSPTLQQLSRAHGDKAAWKYGATEIITTSNNKQTCQCELVSIDCLDSIRCLPDEKRGQELVALGVVTRQIMKETSTFLGSRRYWGAHPMGKSVQYNAMQVWKDWTREKRLPDKFFHMNATFVDPTRYPYCVKHGLIGWGCIFAGYKADEDLSTLESQALVTSSVSADAITATRLDIMTFQTNTKPNQVPTTPTAPPALGHLLTFAHIMRMGFNRRTFVQEIYDKYHTVVLPLSSSHQEDETRLRVSLHMRRADSCNHKQAGYELQVSDLDSRAQAGLKRVCYDTSVYMDGLRRVQRLSGRPLSVYLSTDYAGSVVEEIQRDFPQEYQEMEWHYLNVSRDTFNYKGSVELQGHENHGELGETAIADIWLLSHGQVFVGHMGSRFCKVAWTLATARHNTFVPFRTVDGHSFCCEIDEPCGKMKPYIDSMENCLTFSHEMLRKKHKDYFGAGSEMRKLEFERKAKEADTQKK